MTGIAVITILALLIGLTLSWANRRFTLNHTALSEKINQLLPQTQCGQCGYPGCRPYAQAIVEKQVPINQCPPGGEQVINDLADLLNQVPEPLNPQFGQHKLPSVAVIDATQCIGCALCLPACPVDAIVGAPKYLHQVIETQCTGCELCIEPCPVDCIQMVTEPTPALLPMPEKSDKPCIRCNRCTQVCPVGLDVQTLYHQIRLGDYAGAEAINKCIECGYCVDVCPSEIALLDYHCFGKQENQRHHKDTRKANQAQQHYALKKDRLARQQEQQTRFFANQHTALKTKIQKNM